MFKKIVQGLRDTQRQRWGDNQSLPGALVFVHEGGEDRNRETPSSGLSHRPEVLNVWNSVGDWTSFSTPEDST